MQYYSEIDINNIKIEPLTEENIDLVEGFSCGEIEFDKFIYYNAIDNISKIYLVLYDDKVLGFFGISATGILSSEFENGIEKEKYNKPAIEINYFTINEKYHGMYIDEERSEPESLSDIIFIKILGYINNIIGELIGFKYIVLYSVDKAVNFYKKHDFREFEYFMTRNIKQYLEGCVPLFLRVK